MSTPEIFVEKEKLAKPIPMPDFFGQDGKVIVEIGFGKGHFLRSYALEHPEYNFLGIERFIKWTKHAEERLVKAGILNVRLLCGLAQDVLDQYVKDESIDEIHVTFPDPWPKRRHHKHRILQKKYIELFHKKLKKDGEFHITTDHKDYFEFAMREFAPFDNKLFTIVEKNDYPHKTNYQIKYEKEGRPIYFFQADKL